MRTNRTAPENRRTANRPSSFAFRRANNRALRRRPENEGTPSPTPGSADQNGGENGEQPSPTPAGTPGQTADRRRQRRGRRKTERRRESRASAEVEPEKEGEMSPKQAAALLQSMKDEEQKVQLDEHKRVRPVYNDW